jgi:hypothetical protein
LHAPWHRGIRTIRSKVSCMRRIPENKKGPVKV